MTFLFMFQWSFTSASTWRRRVARVAHVPTLTVTRVAGATRLSCVRLRSSVLNAAISETTTKSVSTRASTGFVLHDPHTHLLLSSFDIHAVTSCFRSSHQQVLWREARGCDWMERTWGSWRAMFK